MFGRCTVSAWLCVGLLTLAVLTVASSAAAGSAGEVVLIPWPRKVMMGEGEAIFDSKLGIVIEGSNISAARKVAETFAADLSETGFAPRVAEFSSTGVQITLRLVEGRSLGQEGYRLSVDRGMTIMAGAERGLFWGTRTALQLLRKGPGASVPKMSIQDEPEYEYRCCLVDVARQFHSIEFHRSMVKRLAAYKMNIYHIHLSDDQSYTLPSDRYPALPTPGRHYAKEQLRTLVKLAAEYHVTLVPELDMPGHSSALCAAVPDLVCRGKRPSGTICVGSDRAFAAVTAVVAEAMDLFPGPYFHLGADECWFAAWDGCPDCAATIAREKLKDNEALYNWFINRMNRFVTSQGRRTIIWEGFKVGKEPLVDKDILVEEFEVKYAMPGDLLDAGYDLINAASCPLYVVEHWATKASDPEHLAEWNPLYFGAGHPSKRISEMIKVSPSPRLKGICLCSWENEERAEYPMLFGIGEPPKAYTRPAPRVPLAAERAWSGSRTLADDLLSRAQRDKGRE